MLRVFVRALSDALSSSAPDACRATEAVIRWRPQTRMTAVESFLKAHKMETIVIRPRILFSEKGRIHSRCVGGDAALREPTACSKAHRRFLHSISTAF